MTQEAHSNINGTQSVDEIVNYIGLQAKKAGRKLAQFSPSTVNGVLESLSKNLLKHKDDIINANNIDVKAAQDKSLSSALIDRLTLNDERIDAIAQSVLDITKLKSPLGTILETIHRPNGLIIEKTSVPIGVLGMIYESRPNVTIDAAALCLKSGNAVILRGGSESFHSSHALYQIIKQTLLDADFPEYAICMMPNKDRAFVGAMLKTHQYIDVIIPRGGKGLTGRVMREATMPVFAHLDGNCHIFVHHSADEQKALDIIKNAKFRRTGICGALESLLIDTRLDYVLAQKIIDMLLENDCVIYGDKHAQSINNNIIPATEEDWSTEYLDKKISLKFIDNTQDAIAHINHYGSHHTDAIIAEDNDIIDNFLNQIDSAIVMHNASTQFADGGEFGMGAEIGIGTGKLHARGPVGLKQLTTFKYIVRGSGQTRG